MRNFILFIAGAVVFAVSELIWLTFCDVASSNWILEPTPGVMLCAFLIIVSCMYFGYKYHHHIKKPISFVIGACLSITVMLFFVGPGNLWPIVLVIDYVIVTVVVYVGWSIGLRIANKKTKTC
jgi:hypothetical protein